ARAHMRGGPRRAAACRRRRTFGQRGTDSRGDAQIGRGARMTLTAVEPWVEPPLKRFVDESRAVLALLLHPSGQVLAQYGFARAVDVMSACALAAAIHASSAELG